MSLCSLQSPLSTINTVLHCEAKTGGVRDRTCMGLRHFGAEPILIFGSLYVWGEKDVLKVIELICAREAAQGFGRVEVRSFPQKERRSLADTMPGGMLSVSANQKPSTAELVWATLPESDCTPGVFCPKPPHVSLPGRLYAYDAETLQWLWDMHLPNNLGHWVPTHSCRPKKSSLGPGRDTRGQGDAQLIAYELGPEGGASQRELRRRHFSLHTRGTIPTESHPLRPSLAPPAMAGN